MSLLLNKAIKAKYSNNLPKNGKILGHILRISLPAAIEAFLISLTGLVDIIMVGKISPQAIASVSITQQPYYITILVAMGLSTGVSAIIARRRGEQDSEGAKSVLRHCIIMAFISSVILTIVFLFTAYPFMILMGAKNDTIDDATLYFQIITISLILISIRIVICAGFRACGDTHITLIINFIANIANLFFNYCLIEGKLGFGRLEVKGAGIATIIANCVALVICIIILFRRKSFVQLSLKDDWHIDKMVTKRIIKISFCAFAELLFMRIGFFIIAIIINNLGTESVTINAVASGVINLSFSISDGFAIGASALVGKTLGEDNKPLAFAYGRMALLVSFLMGLLMVVLIIIFRIPLTNLFTQDVQIVQKAGPLLLFASLVIFPQCLQWVSTSTLRGAGDIKFTAKMAVICIMIIRPIFSFLFCYTLGLGVYGSWLGMLLDQSVRFLINLHRINHLKWMEIKV